ASLGALAAPFSPDYVRLVLTLNLMIGLIKLALGLARLGVLVNFISTTVVVGFTAGAGLLIVSAQLRNFFGLELPQESTFAAAFTQFGRHVNEMDPWAVAVGIATLGAALVGRRVLPRVPYMLSGTIGGAVFAYVLAREGIARVPTIGTLPSALPPLSLPDFSAATWRTLAPAALAL